ncbi:sodium-coupled monocarboxylate transporter 1 [Elysia marginata]|uniref:Sodium-coupled monocarboxylate transporter 1 n=1 Tax=Elysia marginata TaxID=1093978 RepID=A0AAV4GVA7_9GAST|nr:sodium-coupled monocarboxylate transporter 1 [Elysia marginata]
MVETITYSAVDFVVAGLMLAVPTGIGIRYAVRDARRAATREEYLMGGRHMAVLPVALSTFITFVSAVSLMGTPAEMYFFGAVGYSIYMAMSLGHIIAAFTTAPLINPLKLTSVYEYLHLRYQSKGLQMFGTLIGMAQTMIYQAVVLLLPALALQSCADLPLWISLFLFGAVGTVYTTIGGFKSVVWTDVFQAGVVFFGLLIIIIKGCIEVGGISQVWHLSGEGGRLNFDRLSFDPRTRHSQWGIFVGFTLLWYFNSFSQPTAQRISCLGNVRRARMCCLINAPVSLLTGVLTCFTGLTAYAYYTLQRCDPLQAGLISNKNQLAPYFVLHAMADIRGFSGLFLGVISSGSLSTLSSGKPYHFTFQHVTSSTHNPFFHLVNFIISACRKHCI